ncbi:MAG: cell wall hydrolase [Sphingomonadaceae bacterium]
MLTAVMATNGSGALAEDIAPVAKAEEAPVRFVSEAVIQAVPETPAEPVAEPEPEILDEPVTGAQSLRELVAMQPQPGKLSRDMHCLAGAIYFESRGESLAGQLAVGRVIVERADSGRFPNSYCGVVYQRSQFSFVRGKSMPSIKKGSQAWKNAVAMAQIAHHGSWDSPAEGALFFHATYVSPNWRLTRLARVDKHVFYR